MQRATTNTTGWRPTLLLDMDGVVTNFVEAAARVHNLNPAPKVTCWDIEKCWGMSKDEFWAPLEEVSAEYWASMPEFPWTDSFLHAVHAMADEKGARVIFCSSPTYSTVCVAGKQTWLQNRYGHDFRNFCFTPIKDQLANPRTVLVDDNESNCNGFHKAGGNSILFPADYNRLSSVEFSARALHVLVSLKNCLNWL